MTEPQPWRWQSQSPVRADAEGLFVPCAELPDAQIGDSVVVLDPGGSDDRSGTIAALTAADGEQFFRLELDAAP